MIARIVALAILALPLVGWTGHREHPLRLAQSTEAAGQATDIERQGARDMEIGHWYLGRRDYLAAISRFRNVAKRFPASLHVEDALASLVDAYLALGLRSEAERMSAELSRRFPDGQWSASARAALQSAPNDPANSTR